MLASSFFRSAFAFFRPLLPCFRLLSILFFLSALFPVLLTAAPRCSFGSFVPQVFPLPSRLVSHPFLSVLRTWLSCIVSFRPSQFRSRSRSTGAHPTFRFAASSRMLAHAFRPLSLSSGLELNYSASVSSFPFFHRLRFTACFLGFSVPLSLPCFPLLPGLGSRAFFPVLSTQLSVCFLSSFPASLPQPFHRCFPFGFLLGDQRLASVLFRSLPL